MWHDFGGEQFGGPSGGGRVGPLVAHLQHGAETAGLIPQPLHLFARPLGRADDARPVLVDDVDHFVELLSRHRHLRERRHLLEVSEPRRDAELDLFTGLLLGLGEVEQTDQAPVIAVDLRAEGRGALLDDAPVVGQRIETLDDQGRPDGQQADAVLAGQPRARR